MEITFKEIPVPVDLKVIIIELSIKDAQIFRKELETDAQVSSIISTKMHRELFHKLEELNK